MGLMAPRFLKGRGRCTWESRINRNCPMYRRTAGNTPNHSLQRGEQGTLGTKSRQQWENTLIRIRWWWSIYSVVKYSRTRSQRRRGRPLSTDTCNTRYSVPLKATKKRVRAPTRYIEGIPLQLSHKAPSKWGCKILMMTVWPSIRHEHLRWLRTNATSGDSSFRITEARSSSSQALLTRKRGRIWIRSWKSTWVIPMSELISCSVKLTKPKNRWVDWSRVKTSRKYSGSKNRNNSLKMKYRHSKVTCQISSPSYSSIGNSSCMIPFKGSSKIRTITWRTTSTF